MVAKVGNEVNRRQASPVRQVVCADSKVIFAGNLSRRSLVASATQGRNLEIAGHRRYRRNSEVDFIFATRQGRA